MSVELDKQLKTKFFTKKNAIDYRSIKLAVNDPYYDCVELASAQVASK